jgi:CBS domain-containing protein
VLFATIKLAVMALPMRVRVVTVAAHESVQVAVARMLEENIGSVAVCEGPRLVGIFTERDILRLAGEGPDFNELTLETAMTRNPVTISPDADVLDAATLMNERGIRHLPVVEGENLLGMLGIREVLRTLVERLWQTNDPEFHERARELLERRPEVSTPPQGV